MRLLIVVLEFALWGAAEKEIFVYPSILQERTADTKLILRLNDEFTLDLQRSSVLAEKLVFVTTTEEVNHLEEVDTSAVQDTLYHDTRYQSSVRVQRRDDAVKVEGIINHKLRIKPVPEGERSLEGRIPHKIYEVKEANAGPLIMERKSRSSYRGANNYSSPRLTGTSRGELAARTDDDNDVFQVELHIMSDRKHQENFDTNEDLIGYMAVFMNAVNLRYLDMMNPKVRFLLVGITRRKESPFSPDIKGATDTSETLNKLQYYEAEGKVPGKHDAVFLMTGLDLIKVENGRVQKGIAGRAFLGTVCTRHGVGVGEDTATTYLGVGTAAHELAHILGSDHDTTPRCPWEQGYLMSYVDGGVRKYRLSSCTEDSIRNVYRGLSSKCRKVLNKLNYMEQHKEYPGETVREKYYCKKRIYSVAKGLKVKAFSMKPAHDAKKCKMQCCYWKGNMRTCWPTPMLERMNCAKGKTCKRGVCGVHEW